MTKLSITTEILDECDAQDRKWGEQNHPDGTGLDGDRLAASLAKLVYEAEVLFGVITWRSILTEEVAEAYAEKDPVKLRAELIQVAAVCTAWIEAIDRRTDVRPPSDGIRAVP